MIDTEISSTVSDQIVSDFRVEPLNTPKGGIGRCDCKVTGDHYPKALFLSTSALLRFRVETERGGPLILRGLLALSCNYRVGLV